jgi:3-hydroxy acid dehydrogenase/malonic semialdehyde reductase
MLKGHTVMITGASAGIGRACAEAFAREHSRLILAARRHERLEALAADLSAEHGTECHLLKLDVSDRKAVETIVSSLPAEWAGIDVLVNNAGLSRGLDRIQDADPVDWQEMIDTNVLGLLWVTHAVLPGMVTRDRGHVVNIGSVSGHQVYQGGAVYCATKSAVRALTLGLRLDLLGTHVRVSSVDPGLVETDFSLVRFRGDRERADRVYTHYPPLQPEDVAAAVIWCVTRPPRVNVQEIVLMPQDQASVFASYERRI